MRTEASGKHDILASVSHNTGTQASWDANRHYAEQTSMTLGLTVTVLLNYSTSHSFRYQGAFNKDSPPMERKRESGGCFCFCFFVIYLAFFSQTHEIDGYEHFSLRAMLSRGCGAVHKQVGPPASCKSRQLTSAGPAPISLACNHPQPPIKVSFVQRS